MNAVLLVLAVLAIAATQILAGGRQLALSLPGLGLLALAALMSWWPTRRTPLPRATIEGVVTATVLFTCIVVRASFSQEEYLARKDLYMALGAMALYLLVALNLTSSKLRLSFVAMLLVLGGANCAVGAIQFFKGQNFMVFDFLPRFDYGFRVSGFFGYPNYLASFLTVTVLFGLAVSFWSRWSFWVKIVMGYISLVCLVGLFFTGSRGGYVSCAAGLLIFGFLSLLLIRKSGAARTVLIVAGILAVAVLGWGAQQLFSKSYLLHSRASETLTADSSRLMMWRAAWQQFRLQPVTGTGSGTYLYYGRQFRSPRLQDDPINAHNEYIQLLAEYGLLGLAAFVIFLETHLRLGWKSFARRISGPPESGAIGSNTVALNIGALSAAAACLVHSFLDFNLHSPANLLVMAFVFGVLASPSNSAQSITEPEESPGASPYFRLALPALGLWIAIRVLPTLPAEYNVERARLLTSNGNYLISPEIAKAVEDFAQRGLTWDARNPELHFYLGLAQEALTAHAPDPLAQNEFKTKALASYQNAFELAPQDVRLVLSLAWAFQGLQRFSESEPLFTRAVELDPNSGRVRYAYASHLHSVGKLPEAETQYLQSIRLGGGLSPQMGLERLQKERKKQRSGDSEPQNQPPAR